MDFLRSQLFERLKMTAAVNLFSILKLPLLAFITPEFAEFSDEKCVVKVRHGYRTRNHLGSMYFGALAMGAELSIAGAAIDAIQKSGHKIDFIFKGFQSEFLKRADGTILFICDDGLKIRDLIARAGDSGERLNEEFAGRAIHAETGDVVMTYRLTLSVKKRG